MPPKRPAPLKEIDANITTDNIMEKSLRSGRNTPRVIADERKSGHGAKKARGNLEVTADEDVVIFDAGVTETMNSQEGTR